MSLTCPVFNWREGEGLSHGSLAHYDVIIPTHNCHICKPQLCLLLFPSLPLIPGFSVPWSYISDVSLHHGIILHSHALARVLLDQSFSYHLEPPDKYPFSKKLYQSIEYVIKNLGNRRQSITGFKLYSVTLCIFYGLWTTLTGISFLFFSPLKKKIT